MKPDRKKRKHQKRHNEFKRHVKHHNDRKNRSKTRQLINNGDFDALSETTQAKREDVWSWD